MSLFGGYFKHLRKNYTKKTLRSFCKDAELDAVRISKIERGVIVPDKEEVNKLKIAFGESINEDQHKVLLELSTIKDVKTFDTMSKEEIARKKKDHYLSGVIHGNEKMTWEAAESIVRDAWTP